MQKNKRRHKILKWAIGIIGGIIVLLGIAALYFSAKWKPLVTEKLKAGVYNGSDHLYRISFKDIHLNLFSGNITLDSISLVPDTNVYDTLRNLGRAPAHVFELKLAKLELSRISILTAYFKRKVEMNAIILHQPSINMIYHKVPRKPDTAAAKTLYQQLSGTLKSIHVKAIKVIDADFDYYSRANTQRAANAIKHLNVNIKDVLIDSATQFDTVRMLYAKDINFELTGYQATTKDKMYNMKIDTVTGSATAGYISVRNLKLIPLYPDLTFSRKYSTQKDRYDLTFKELDLSGINFRLFNTDGKLHARKLTVGPADVAVFMNRELPPPNLDKARNFPHLALRRLPLEVKIDSVRLKKVDVAYTEFSEQTKKRGTVVLKNLSGVIRNVTNDSVALVKDHIAVANLQTAVMGTGALAIQINFNLTAANGAFDYTGRIGAMDLKVVNPLATNLGLVSIESGKVNKLDFNIHANTSGSTGIVHMYYNDLKVNLLKKEDGKIKEKGLLSFLANNLLVINNNPKKEGEPLRDGKVTFSRPPSSSFFNLLWKSVFTGIRESVGIGIVPMKSPPKPKKK